MKTKLTELIREAELIENQLSLVDNSILTKDKLKSLKLKAELDFIEKQIEKEEN